MENPLVCFLGGGHEIGVHLGASRIEFRFLDGKLGGGQVRATSGE